MGASEMKKKKIMIITAIRSEYNILHPIIKSIKKHPLLDLKLIVTGAHLTPSFGSTVKDIENDGFKIDEKIESLLDSDSPSGRAKSIAIQLFSLINTVERLNPDIIIAPFDREEALTAAIVGTYLNVPIIHIGGGDKVEGNVDDYVRHAVTKLSHLHFPTTKENADRIIKMGEEKWRVHVVGNPGLDKFRTTKKISKKELGSHLDFDFSDKPLIILLQHPLSTEYKKSRGQIKITLQALKELEYDTVIIKPNSDSGSRSVIQEIDNFTTKFDFMKSYVTLERSIFVNLLRAADVMVGNSSCGICEAPLLKLPVVNVGMRQKERLHGENVIFVSHNKNEIKNAINKVLCDKKFLEKIKNCKNPYGDGRTGERIAKILAKMSYDKNKLLIKKMVY